MSNKKFVAINYIDCNENYKQRFEELFSTRAHAIDRMPGFQEMHVLKPNGDSGQYLIVSYWDTEEQFKTWTSSPEFVEGHKRGFADIAQARAEGKEPPMKSTFKTYSILTN